MLPAPVSAQVGVAETVTVATFTTLSSAIASQFTATINWGDGSAATAGTVTAVSGSPGSFIVTGSHTYASEGRDTVNVTVTQTGAGTATALDTAGVSGMHTTANAVTAVEGSAFTTTLATFTDSDSGVTASQFTATINWGDGQSSTGTVTADAHVSGQFDVAGTHLYAQSGVFPFTVTIVDARGHTAIASANVNVGPATLAVSEATSFAATEGVNFTGAGGHIYGQQPRCHSRVFHRHCHLGRRVGRRRRDGRSRPQCRRAV